MRAPARRARWGILWRACARPCGCGRKKKKNLRGGAIAHAQRGRGRGWARASLFGEHFRVAPTLVIFPRGPGFLAATRSVLSGPCLWRRGSLFTSSIQDFSSSHETIITRRHRYLSSPNPRDTGLGGGFRPSAQPLCLELRGKGRGACITASLALRALYKDDFLYKRLFVEVGRGC